MNLSGINLNHLPILNVLLQEKSVTLAATRLNMPQSNVSRVLQELRSQLNDRLLVRGKFINEMELTPKAHKIAPLIKRMIYQVNNIINISERFDPSQINITFTIAMSEIISRTIFTDLTCVLDKAAPNASIVVKTLNDFYKRQISKIDEIDLTIISDDNFPPDFKSELLISSENVCVVSKNNKHIKNKHAIDILKDYYHIVPLEYTFDSFYSNWYHLYKTINRYISDVKTLEVCYLDTISKILEKGDFLIFLPDIVARKLFSLTDIEIMKLPFNVPKCNYFMAWPEYRDADMPRKWFRAEVLKIFTVYKQV